MIPLGYYWNDDTKIKLCSRDVCIVWMYEVYLILFIDILKPISLLEESPSAVSDFIALLITICIK